MDAAEIREPVLRPELTAPATPDYVTVLPPREGFSPRAVGAIGLLVHRMGAQDDVVLGEAGRALTFSGRRFVPVQAPPLPWLGRAARYQQGVLRSLRRLAPRLVEVHNRAGLALAVSRADARRRVALFVHNDPQAMRGARRPAERATLLGRLTVVCVSRYLAGRFMEGLDPGGPAPLVLPNAIDLAELPQPSPVGARAREILFVGRVVSDKGADAFVEACAATLPDLPGWRAVMIGADRFWPGAAETAFERALRPRAMAAGIAWRGYQTHGEVLHAMARAAIVVVPSRWAEPFGMVALEAAASGAALACSLRGGLPEVVGESALPIDPDEPGSVAAAILRLARDDELRSTLVEAGLARARGFDVVGARARLMQVRQDLLF